MHCALAHAYESTRAVIEKMAKRVRFSDSAVEAAREGSEHEEDDHSSAEDSFCEITTSEGESFNSSDDEDANRWQVLLEQAYTSSPDRFSSLAVDPAQRSSLLLLDKDFIDSDELSEGRCVVVLYMCVGVGVALYN